MKCEDIKKLIPSFLDNELSENDCILVKQHIADCLSCQKELEKIGNIQSNVREILRLKTSENEPSSDTWIKIRQKIAEEKQSSLKKKGLLDNSRLSPDKLLRKAGFTAVIVVLLSIVIIQPIWEQEHKTLSIQIALSNSEVQTAIGGSQLSLDEMTVINSISDRGYSFIILIDEADHILITKVDTKTEKVLQLYEMRLDSNTKQKVIDIACTDSEAALFIERGASISFSDIYFGIVTKENGENYLEDTIEFTVRVNLTLDKDFCSVFVNLTNESIDSTISPIFLPETNFITVISPIMLFIGILMLIDAVFFTKKSTIPIVFSSIVFGITGLFAGLFGVLYTTSNLTTNFLIPIVGMILGIIEIKRESTNNRLRIIVIGTILCILVIILDIILITTGTREVLNLI